jgi:hypothetical protein
MVLMNATHTLLNLAVGGSTATVGTAVAYARTEKANVSVVLTANTGTETVVVEGTTEATSTGTFVTIDTTASTASTGTTKYDVGISAPYTFIRAQNTTALSTGGTLLVTAITQGAGY